MNNKLKIWCTYHSDNLITEYNLKEDNIHSLFGAHKIDLKEKNINKSNKLLNEFVTMYYVWANKKYSEYVGFEHYKRKFENINKIKFNIDRLDNNYVYGRIVTLNLEYTLKQQYLSTLPNQLFYDIIDILNNTYNINNKYSIYLETSNNILWDECFIMKYENFDKMMIFIWNILLKLDKKINGNNFDIETYKKYYNIYDWYSIRVGHMIERLISCWIFCNYNIKNIIEI